MYNDIDDYNRYPHEWELRTLHEEDDDYQDYEDYILNDFHDPYDYFLSHRYLLKDHGLNQCGWRLCPYCDDNDIDDYQDVL